MDLEPISIMVDVPATKNDILLLTQCEQSSAQLVELASEIPGVRPISTAALAESQADTHLILKRLDGIWTFQLPRSGAMVPMDFTAAATKVRLARHQLSSELVVKAVFGRSRTDQPLSVIDATAGLARDAVVLAAAGCRVTMIERVPLLALLLQQMLATAQQAGGTVSESVARISCIQGDSQHLLSHWSQPPPQVIFLDPMYHADGQPGLKPTAAVKKHSQLLHLLVEHYLAHHCVTASAVADEKLLEIACRLASQKVVVKRAPRAPALGSVRPSSSLASKGLRFDIYAC